MRDDTRDIENYELSGGVGVSSGSRQSWRWSFGVSANGYNIAVAAVTKCKR